MYVLMNSNTLDIVYTWVNGNDPDYQQLYNRYSDKPCDINPERYRDIYSCLKYSLRSVEKFAPWVGDIYLFTRRPQYPDWLKINHPRVHLVHHDELIDECYLPTFSSNVIETFLHEIPNRSEYLLYMNDDYLFGNHVNMEDFIDSEGKIRIYKRILGERFGFRVYDQKNELVSIGRLEHIPILIHKPTWHEMLRGHESSLHQTRLNRFRHDNDLKMDKLYKYHMLKHKSDRSIPVPFYKTLGISTFHKITNDYEGQCRKIRNISRKQPKFLCLNDDQRDNPDQRVTNMVKEFLDTCYPEPSEFEL